MKLIAIYLIFITFGLQSISLEAVRSDFRTAAKDNAKVSQFNNALKHINENDMVELIAYKGAGITLKSRLSKKIKGRDKTIEVPYSAVTAVSDVFIVDERAIESEN